MPWPDASGPRLVCLGLSAWDQSWQVDTLPAGSGKTRANGHHEGGGGMAATAAVAAARLGAAVQFWGRAGDDPAGRAMRDELAQAGVGVDAFRLFEGARSSISCVIVDADGERLIVNYRGGGLPDEAGWLPLDRVAQAQAVLADPRWPDGALALFGSARRHGVPSVLDADVAEAAVFDALLPWTDHAVFSEPSLAAYGSADVAASLERVRARGARVAAVTLGERGLCWVDDAGLQSLPAFPVDVVDTNGAGDVFHGALAHALASGRATRDAYRFASAVAALKCTRPGGRAGVPDLAGANDFLNRYEE